MSDGSGLKKCIRTVSNIMARLWIVFALLLLSVSLRSNADNNTTTPRTEDTTLATNYFRNLKDVTVEPYENPCDPFTPEMPDFSAPGRRISEVKCFEYAWKAKSGKQEIDRSIECARKIYGGTLLIGGRDAEFAEFAHIGALGWKARGGIWIFKCGASLISEKFALTAAHCSRIARAEPDIDGVEPKIIRLGAKTIRYRGNDAKIKQIIVHPQYRAPLQYYDIALIEITQQVEYQWLYHPACLDSSFESPEKGFIAGWGVVNLATLQTSPTLQFAEVDVINSSFCDSLFQFRRNRKWRGLANHQICAGHMEGGRDTCQGDSGGPFSVELDFGQTPGVLFIWTLHRVIGVTSFGYGCAQANSPGIYTRVASFIDWIESIVWPETNNTSTTTT